MDNDEQWLERALTRERESLDAGSGVMGELFKQYDQALCEIRVSVNDFLVRYEDEQGSAYDKAAKSLNTSEIQEWKDSVNDWAQSIGEEKDDAAKQLLQSRLKSVKCSDPPLTRLDLASRQIRIALDDLSAKNVRQMWNAFESLYSEAYYKKIFDIEQRYGLLREFKKPDAKLDDVLSHPWSGLNFTDRMAENINMLHFQMRETIIHGLIHGKSSIEILKDLSDQTGASYKHLERLVQTESAYFHSEAIRMAYEASGVKQYEYVAKLDRRTSDTCLSLDGKKFNVSDAKRGINYPPMHPRCRSTTIENADGIDESRMSGPPLPKDMTYEQWHKERVEGTGKPEVERGSTPLEHRYAIDPDTKKPVDFEWIPSRKIDPVAEEDMLDRVSELKGLLSNSVLKKVGNFAWMKVNIEGVTKKEFYAHSRVNSRNGNPKLNDISVVEENKPPIFKATEAPGPDGIPYSREPDSEYKMFNDLASQLGNNVNAKGYIKLFTEKDTCGSCNNIISKFKEKYPNIIIEIVHNGGIPVIPKK
ncbi:deaminase domain-containing protein [Paenibacillus agilis]|uniref:deaminase domain-containing protein n=1 Tax=Paenibacillus agilis TaxID=3020863 RepID=UPI0021BD3B1D|nr:deaminase domain-containing protein [Paenibacillus agilis]